MESAVDQKTSKDIFKGVTYYIVGEISEEITSMLNENGAKRDSYLSEMVSHVIADRTNSDDYSEAKELFELPIVTSDWVTLSVRCKRQLPKEIFALEGRIFSGVVACPDKLETEDIVPLWCMLVYYGAKCQLTLDNKVTHLITFETTGVKYNASVEKPEIKVVTPDWITDSIDKDEKLDEKIYHPTYIEYPKPEPEVKAMEVDEAVSKPNQTISTTNSSAVYGNSDQQTEADETMRIDIPRPDTPSAKEALARKLNRKQSKGSEPTTPEKQSGPLFRPVGSPGASNLRMSAPCSSSNVRVMSPVPSSGVRITSPVPMGLQTRPDGNIRSTLRNISNRASTPNSMQMRPNMPMGAARMSQMSPVGARPPPPDYPFTSRGPMSASQTHMPPSSPQQTTTQYYGHDSKENIGPDLCLLGCIFCIVDYDKHIGVEEITEWKTVIESFGGQIEHSYCYRVTHVLCPNQKSEICKMALKEGKRVVTAFWLNDCVVQKKMVPPWQAIHLPLSFNSEKPGFSQRISVTNFDGEERKRLKLMIKAIGAKYTAYMTHQNSTLICKRPGGKKFEKAKEWKIAVVNVQWLSDLVLGNMDAMRLPVHVRYLQVGLGREFHMDLSRVTHLMGGWKTPLRIHKDTWKKLKPLLGLPSGQENSTVLPPSPKRQKLDNSSQIPNIDSNAPRIMFTLYKKSQTSQLEAMVKQLGGVVVTNPLYVTHLVAPFFARTYKVFIAINVCQHIVTKEWIEESAKHDRFIDESTFALKDEKAEKSLALSIAQSIQRARTKPLFQGLTFYLTPGVNPSTDRLSTVIKSAGGAVVKKRFPAKQIASMLDDKGNPKFIVITCENDLHLLSDMRSKKIPVYSAEFVLTGVLKQEIDFIDYIVQYVTH